MKVALESKLADLGLVAIGRNEGERLQRCLDSIPQGLSAVVYVDSGSTDGSRERAAERGVAVVDLDLARPFTAARARNAGFERLLEIAPGTRAVQFVDGDCSLAPGWLEAGIGLLDANPDWVAVCGYRREQRPEASIYNLLCDLEWTAAGPGDVGDFGFGGDVLIRTDALRAVGGYDERLIAGEDPELSARLRWAGGRVMRVDREMTRHDADMHRFRQWWTRCVRAGHAFAEVAARHRDRGLFRRNLRSIAIWGGLLPALLLGGALALPVVAVGVLALYALQVARIARGMDPGQRSPRERVAWGLCCMASQLPKAWGASLFYRNRLRGRRQEIIEYK